MPMLGGRTSGFKVPELQADAVLNQANPVSGTKYTVLATTRNVRIIGVEADVTWTVQPDPLELHFTVDGNLKSPAFNNPVSTTSYYVEKYVIANMFGLVASDNSKYWAFLCEARTIKVEAETTGGTTQNLAARVIYQKW